MTAGPGARIRHPGPVQADRHSAVPCRLHPLSLTLPAHAPLHDALVQAVGAAGYRAAHLRLSDVEVEALDYVIPAPAPGDGRAAWYSDTRHIEKACIHFAGLHLGEKAGEPFAHCHGIWSGADGRRAMGHLLPEGRTLTRQVKVEGWGISGAILRVQDDAETGFSLFAPVASGAPSAGGAQGLLYTLRPNSDVTEAVEQVARAHRMRDCAVEGLGSLVGTTFVGGAGNNSYATEVLVTEGAVSNGKAAITAASVGFDGSFRKGVLRRGVNNVCVTAEMLFRMC